MKIHACVALLIAGASFGACRPTPAPEPAVSHDDRDMVASWNREARAGGTADLIFGELVRDPYRALEEDSPMTRQWMRAQTDRTTRALAETSDATRDARLRALLSIGSLGGPRFGGGAVFYTLRDGDAEQAQLRRSRGEEDALIFDPNEEGPRVSIDGYLPSPDGRLLALLTSRDGDERSTLRFLDLEHGTELEDRIPHTKWASVTWLPDGSGVYYTRYPRAGEPDHDPSAEDTYHRHVFFHAIGTDPARDPRIFAVRRAADFANVRLDDDGRFLMIHVSRGWAANDLFMWDRGAAPASRATIPAEGALRPIFEDIEAVMSGRVHRGTLYLRTNAGSPRYRIDALDAATASIEAPRRAIVPEGEGTIDGFVIAGEHLVLHHIEALRSKVTVHALDGSGGAELALPGVGEVHGLDADITRREFGISFSGPVHAPSIHHATLPADAHRTAPNLEEVRAIPLDLDPSRYLVETRHTTSADGTEVPMTVIRARATPLDGRARAIVYGYGGFDVSLLPSFARNVLYWLDRGGVYITAHLRGGGELGQAWHRAGMREHKERVFEDMEAVVAYAATSGLSAPDRIAITGGSNGGLLMGAMLTRCPERFAAVASYVGLYDMVRYHRFPPAELWIPEYGSADDPELFPILHRYSPYHRISPREYPATLIETADHDTRVHFGHSTKFTAALQEAQTGDAPIYFYLTQNAGHGSGSGLGTLVERYQRFYGFLEAHLAE